MGNKYSNASLRRPDWERQNVLNQFWRAANSTWTTRSHTCQPRRSVLVCARGPSNINKTQAPPRRSSTHSRGQWSWPTERSIRNNAKISWRRQPIPHAERYISPGNPATLAPNTRRNFLHLHDAADHLSFYSIKTSMFYTVLSTHK